MADNAAVAKTGDIDAWDGDANRTITNGRFLMLYAENFAAFPDGSKQIRPHPACQSRTKSASSCALRSDTAQNVIPSWLQRRKL